MEFDRATFERAFDAGVGSSCRTCVCGWTFYNPDASWDWEEGELDELANNQRATMLDYPVQMVRIDGYDYVVDCTCWVGRGRQIAEFLEKNKYSVAKYLSLRKKSLENQARLYPTVEGE